MQIAVVGNDDFVTGFQLAGVKLIYPAKPHELDEKVKQVLELENVGILIMHEHEFQKLSVSNKRKLEKTITPVIVTLGGMQEKSGLRELIKKSVGVDLWK